MTILPWESLAPLRDPPSALTIGVFDGIHLGHQRLIAEIVEASPGLVPVVCSFRQNPASVLGSRQVPGSILSPAFWAAARCRAASCRCARECASWSPWECAIWS